MREQVAETSVGIVETAVARQFHPHPNPCLRRGRPFPQRGEGQNRRQMCQTVTRVVMGCA